MGGGRLAAAPQLSAVALILAAAATIAGLAAAAGPSLVRGDPLGDATGLRLLAADNPPFVLDVDTGAVTRTAGIPRAGRRALWVVGVGGRGAVVVDQSAPGCVHPRVCTYGTRDGRRAVALGAGTTVTVAADAPAVWLRSRLGRDRCAVRRLHLSGRATDSPRAFPCGTRSDAGGSLGLVVRRLKLVDPTTGRIVLRTRLGILAVAKNHVLLDGPGDRFTLLDARDRTARRLPWPSVLRWRGESGAVDPSGRFVVLEFGDPAWAGGSAQAIDLWLVDTNTGALIHVPSMPAFVSLKFTSTAWTRDGRLVLLGERARGGFVAVWRPGERTLRVKAVKLPSRTTGSDSFAVLG